MKRHFLSLLLLSSFAAAGFAQPLAEGYVPVDRTKFPDYRSGNFNPDPVAARFVERYEAAAAAGRRGAAATGRPDHVNNAATRYFPPVFNQSSGSCGSASRIAYMFSHEQNAYRDRDGMKPENYFPTHFVWLLTYGNSGKDEFITNVGVPSAKTYGGQTYSNLFGYNEWDDEDAGWMTGYEKWFEAFHYRCTSPTSNVASVGTEAGAEFAKNWLWNHCGDTSFHAGGLIGLGVASGGKWKAIPKTAANDEAGVTGMYYVSQWGTSVDHALTMVGYDDRIEFDLDGDGIYGEKNEKGAWIIVNSWGAWCNGGFIYCPYAYAGSAFTTDGKFNGDFWWGEFYHVRKDYRPLRTIRLKMDYSHRSELLLQAGVSTDLTAEMPESMISMDHFKYAGDGHNGELSPAPAVPMLGRWADGKLHTEPMEFGYDLTDLSAGYDRNQPLKYFFIITRKKDKNAGSGHIYEAGIIDYEHDLEGVETPFDLGEDGIFEITQNGNRTIISTIVYGAGYNSVNSLSIADGTLKWEAPVASAHELSGYRVYAEDELVAEYDKHTCSYAIGESNATSFAVTAVYADGQESTRRQVSAPVTLPERNQIYSFSKAGFTIPGVFKSSYEQATIEFWIRPTAFADWNNAAGPGWGTWYQHCDAQGRFYCGWNTSARLISSSPLALNEWSHIAIVIDKSKLYLYVNGKQDGMLTAPNYSGIGGFGDFVFDSSSSGNHYQRGYYDEIRIWNCVRTSEQIQAAYAVDTRHEFYGDVLPQGLVAYFKGASFQNADGQWLMTDCVGGHHAKVSTTNSRSAFSSYPAFVVPAAAGSVAVNPPSAVPAGQPVTLSAVRNDYVNHLEWTIPMADGKQLTTTAEEPTVSFAAPGQYEVKLTGTDYSGNTSTSTATVSVGEATAPDASFTASKTVVSAGERISFRPATCIPGCSYVWTMPGAVLEEVRSVSAGATYEAFGTYNVTLTVTDATGHSASTTQQVSVEEVAPVADFDIDRPVVQKGEYVLFTDRTKFAPNKWQWQLNGTPGAVIINGQNTAFKAEKSGVYNLTLVASNGAGTSRATRERALVVVNADSRNGLSFSQQGATVKTAENPLPEGQRNYTVSWWMNPNKLADYCEGLGATDATFQIKTAADGRLCISNKGKLVNTAPGIVESGAWHHYAVTVSGTVVAFYKDGVKVGSGTTTSGLGDMPAFHIGTTAADWNGSIDELRIYDRTLTAEEIASTVNAPLETPTADENLVLYYDFNQNGGDVQDRSSRVNNGQRSGFGPDGDAWGLSLGVFSIAEGESAKTDVTAEYLTNYKRSFSRTTKQVNTSTANRFYEIKDWTLENTVTSGSTVTGVHVDTQKSNDFTCTTGWDGFGDLKNHKAYQSIALPEGIYTLDVSFGMHGASGDSYLVAAAGSTLPDGSDLEAEALSYAPLTDATMTFIVTEPQTVNLGVLVASMSGKDIFTIQKFQLWKAPLDVREANIPVGVESVPLSTASDKAFYDLHGRRILHPAPGQVYVTGGRTVIAR